MTGKHKPPARLRAIECEICKYNACCAYGRDRERLYRAGVTIRMSDCALYNGGKVAEPSR